MVTSPAIEAIGLTKRYRGGTVVDDLSFRVEHGRIVGFLGPNGAGKTTTLRMLLGLAKPTAGDACVTGVPYPELADPARTIGAFVDASGFHPSRTARQELRICAALTGVADHRVATVLDLVGLADAGDKRVGAYSLGMRQRLGLAIALLGDPPILVLDEPANGLDPAGHHWLRDLLRGYANEGRTVLVSSHVLSEVAQLVDDVIVINRGRLVLQQQVDDLLATTETVLVRTPFGEELTRIIRAAGGTAERSGPYDLTVGGIDAATLGQLALDARIVVHQLITQASSLEDVFLEMTEGTTIS